MSENAKKITYAEILSELTKEVGLNNELIEDYRPCCDLFGVPSIPGAIIVWLLNGSKIIYISKNNKAVESISESVREMTMEKLINERDKYMAEADRQYQNKRKLECQIKEMQSHIDCLKAELAEIQQNKPELPAEPIKAAGMLISATSTYTNLLGKEQDYKVYDKSELRQIAEHLLVYCNHAEVE